MYVYIGYNNGGRFCTCQMMCKKQRSFAEIDKYENQRILKFKPRLLKKFLWEVTQSDNLEREQKFFIDFVPQRISWWIRAQLLLWWIHARSHLCSQSQKQSATHTPSQHKSCQTLLAIVPEFIKSCFYCFCLSSWALFMNRLLEQ